MPNPVLPALDAPPQFVHRQLGCGVEFAADVLPERQTVALAFRLLSGIADEPEELNGISLIVEQTLSKGTEKFNGRGLSDAFDRIGAQWGTGCGRQSTLVRVLCLPEFVEPAIELVAEMLCRPTFPAEACRVAIEHAETDLRHLEDEPDDLLRIMIQRLTFGPVYGRHVGGTFESLARITPERVREQWQRTFHAGRLQVAAAGPLEPERIAAQLDASFAGLGDSARAGRGDAQFGFTPAREHRHKELEQQYIGLTLPGLPRSDPDFAVEQVLIGVLSGGMSGRLFTEVREKQGLVYWVGAWHEQPRGRGIIHLGASTTPERCDKTLATLLAELTRLAADLTEREVERAKNSLISQALTEDDLTRSRVGGLSDDLFHFGKPIGLGPKLDAVRGVTLARAQAYAARLPKDTLCVATLGPRAL